MDQQVSPAVVIVVLILVVAIMVALYFLWAQRPESEEGTGAGVPVDSIKTLAPEGEEPPAEEGAVEEEAPAEGEAAEMTEGGEAPRPEATEAEGVEEVEERPGRMAPP